MSTDDSFGFAPPPFNVAEALVQLRRQLRELKLEERGGSFQLKGRAVVDLKAGNTSIEARLVKRPALAPEWTTHPLKSAADTRRFIDTVRLQLGRWSADD